MVLFGQLYRRTFCDEVTEHWINYPMIIFCFDKNERDEYKMHVKKFADLSRFKSGMYRKCSAKQF